MVRSFASTCVVVLFASNFLASAPSSVAHAQEQEPAPLAGAFGLDPAAPITLRPTPAFRELAMRVALVLTRRTGVPVTVGDAPPGGVLEAVPHAHIAIAERDDHLALVLAGERGLVFTMDIEVPEDASESAVRELALAIESLRDNALESPSTSNTAEAAETREVRSSTRWSVVDGSAVRAGGEPWRTANDARLPFAKPTVYLRALFGYSPARSQPMVGLGTGLGLCLGEQCVVFEADVPLVVDSRLASGFTVRYRFLDFAARFQYRPWRLGSLTPGFSLGAVMRIGSAEISGSGGASSTTSNLGIRAGSEIAWRFHSLFELVLEAGVDYSIDRSTFVNRDGAVLVLEDRWTPWIITSVRLRP